MTFGIRGIDLESGSELFSHETDFSPVKTPSLKTDAEREEYLRKLSFFNGSLAVNSTGAFSAVGGVSFGGDLCIIETRTAKYVAR